MRRFFKRLWLRIELFWVRREREDLLYYPPCMPWSEVEEELAQLQATEQRLLRELKSLM